MEYEDYDREEKPTNIKKDSAPKNEKKEKVFDEEWERNYWRRYGKKSASYIPYEKEDEEEEQDIMHR